MLEQDRIRLGLIAAVQQSTGQVASEQRAFARPRFDAHSYSSLIGLPVVQVAAVQVLDPASDDFGKFIPLAGFNDL